jgi:hypothetical protein
MADAIEVALGRPQGAVPADALFPFTREAAIGRYLRIIEQAA